MTTLKQIAIVTIIFAVSSLARAEFDARSYSQGDVFIEYGAFNKDARTEEELNSIRGCRTYPGIDGYLPFTVPQNLWVVVRGDKFVVHPSLISPLYNLHVGPKFYKRTFSVKSTNSGLVVSVSGGDGSGSYDVQFDVNLVDMRVVRKLYQYPDRNKPIITTGEVIYAGKAP